MGPEAISKMTRQRRVVLEALRRMRSHPDAAQVYEAVRRTLPKISLSTVYRNLEVLSKAGLISKVEAAGNRMRFDGQIGPHYHVECVKCGRVEDITLKKPVSVGEEEVSKRSEFEIVGHRLEYLGICPQCAAKAGKGASEGKRGRSQKGTKRGGR